jgi:hypothetical protein
MRALASARECPLSRLPGAYASSVNLRHKLKKLFRKKPLTPEALATRTEAEARASIARGEAEIHLDGSYPPYPPGY